MHTRQEQDPSVALPHRHVLLGASTGRAGMGLVSCYARGRREAGTGGAAGAGHSPVLPGTGVLELQCLHETSSRLFHSSLLLSDVCVSAAVSNLGQWLSCVSWF